MKRIAALAGAALLFASTAGFAQQQSPPEQKLFSPGSNFLSPAGFRKVVLAELVPTGQLRVAIAPNPLIFTFDRATGQLRGVAPDLARELATVLGVPFTPLDLFNVPPSVAIARILEGATTGTWDVAFTASETERLHIMDFSLPFMDIDLTYLVRPGLTIRTVAEADRPGVRIAVARGVASDRFLSAVIRSAELVRADTLEAAFEALRAGRADVMAAGRPILIPFAERLPGSRILEDRFSVDALAVAVRKGRPNGLTYVTAFVEWAKTNGVVQRAIDRSGIRGLKVAPPATSR